LTRFFFFAYVPAYILVTSSVIQELVKMCTSLPSSDVADDVATASAAVAAEVNGTPPPRVNPVSEAAAKRRYKYPYVASEVLSADITLLYDVMVNSDPIMDELLGSIEATPQGQLDGFLAGHMNKVCVALLSARNERMLAHMARRPGFVKALLSHVAVGAIADLLVHLLDAPEREPQRMYGVPEDNSPPSPAALHLLARADILRGLAVAAVHHALPVNANRKLLASVANLAGTSPPSPPCQPPPDAGVPNGHGPAVVEDASPVDDDGGRGAVDSEAHDLGALEDTLSSDTVPTCDGIGKANGHDDNEGDAVPVEAPDSMDVAPPALRALAVQASETAAEAAEETPSSRRLREEALGNAAVAFLGLSHRVLRLPPRDVPDVLSPYSSPGVVSLLVDAGLRASQGPGSAPTLLLQALGVAADLVAAPRAVMQAAAAAEENGGDVLGDDGWGGPTSFGPAGFNPYSGSPLEPEQDSAPPSGTGSGDNEVTDSTADGAVAPNAKSISGAADLDIGACLPAATAGAPVDVAGDQVSSPTSNSDPVVESDASKEASALTRDLEVELSARFERLASLLVPPGHVAQETPEAKKLRELQSAPLTSSKDQMPLGAARLKVAEFFSACLRSAGPEALEVLSACRVPETLLALFTRHEWSSMLHGVVSSAVIAAAEAASEHREYVLKVWLDADIIGWLIPAWTRASAAPHVEEENGSSVSTEDGAPESMDSSQSPPPNGSTAPGASAGPRRRQRRDRDVHGNVKFRPGYMGHLIQMSSALRAFLVQSTEDQAERAGFTAEIQEKFSRFCSDLLDDAVALEGRVLGGERPPGGVGSEGEEVCEAGRMFDLSGVELQTGEEASDDLDSNDVVARFARILLAKDPGLTLGSLEQEDVQAPGTHGAGGEAEDADFSMGEYGASHGGALPQDFDEDEDDEDGSYAAFKRESRQSATLIPSGDTVGADAVGGRSRRSDAGGKFPPSFRAESQEELTNQLKQIAAARQGGAGAAPGEPKVATAPVPVVDLDVDADTALTPVDVDPDAADAVATKTLGAAGGSSLTDNAPPSPSSEEAAVASAAADVTDTTA